MQQYHKRPLVPVEARLIFVFTLAFLKPLITVNVDEEEWIYSVERFRASELGCVLHLMSVAALIKGRSAYPDLLELLLSAWLPIQAFSEAIHFYVYTTPQKTQSGQRQPCVQRTRAK